jgi:hypothetical protein
LKRQLVNYPKGSAQRENCEEQIRMQEKQLRLVTAGQMGVAQ